jgi:hypothetical protein
MLKDELTDRQTDMMKSIVALRNVVNAPRNGQCSVKIKIEKFTYIMEVRICDIWNRVTKSGDLIIVL